MIASLARDRTRQSELPMQSPLRGARRFTGGPPSQRARPPVTGGGSSRRRVSTTAITRTSFCRRVLSKTGTNRNATRRRSRIGRSGANAPTNGRLAVEAAAPLAGGRFSGTTQFPCAARACQRRPAPGERGFGAEPGFARISRAISTAASRRTAVKRRPFGGVAPAIERPAAVRRRRPNRSIRTSPVAGPFGLPAGASASYRKKLRTCAAYDICRIRIGRCRCDNWQSARPEGNERREFSWRRMGHPEDAWIPSVSGSTTKCSRRLSPGRVSGKS